MNEELLPPNDKQAEKAVLGSILRDRTALDVVEAILRTSDFYLGAHQAIWRVFKKLRDKGQPIDAVTVADELKVNNLVAEIGGYGYIAELFQSAPSGAADYHATIVRNVAIRRELIQAANIIVRESYTPRGDVNELLAMAEELLAAIFQRRYTGALFANMPEVVQEALEALDRRSGRHERPEESLLSGFIDLDSITSGFHKRELVVLAARPSVGKTLLAMNIAGRLACAGKRIFVASLEQGTTELVHRMFSNFGHVDGHNIRRGRLDRDETARIHEAADQLRGLNILFDDSSSQSAARITSNARRIHAQGGLDMIVVDYLQLMEGESGRTGDNEIIGRNAMRMKQLAKEFNIPVLLLAQLNRQLESRKDPRPRLSDLRGSGEIEQHADTVLMLHKPEEPDRHREMDLLEVYVEKQRNGPKGEVMLLHRKRFFAIENYAPGEPNAPGN